VRRTSRGTRTSRWRRPPGAPSGGSASRGRPDRRGDRAGPQDVGAGRAEEGRGAVVRALQTAERVGTRFSEKSLHALALREGLKLGGVDSNLLKATITDLSRDPGERAWYGIRRLPNGHLTTAGIEQTHARLCDAVSALGRQGKLMSGGVAEPAADLQPMLGAFRATGSRVHVVGGPGTAAELGRAAGVAPERVEAFAARVDAKHRDPFLGGLGPRSREAAEAASPLQLGPADVVVLDVRRTGAHIAETAARSGAGLIVVGRLDPPATTRAHEHERGVDRS
jgi:hypothetical protein